MLSLPSANTPIVYQNPLSKLVTSLPYIDEDLDKIQKNQIERMIRKEMAQMSQNDYLENLPAPKSTLLQSQFIQVEFERVTNKKLLEPPKQRNLPLINISSADNEVLKSFIEEVKIISQHNCMKLINLELFNKFGQDQHKIFIEYLNNRKKNLEEENQKLIQEKEDINAKRKFQQSLLLDKISNLKYKINYLINTNEFLETDCQKLENEIIQIRRKQLKLI
ncbi:hypothetical protein IMG5_001090 [Ichthyophthirius multifiliis]|uniref:Uncharacterized protein n=1 Tax=Ichthyophthirius multifiliis TaxID=5932 RepID=G0QIQ0_ICHMU|nr:hypothetical protein IMG5_001090 [Ichthyophthirius multifiliis]EGR34879.1 hypothetical protein IMG5_001090 [Ichthyophthirius multifiliis]|eukprot:XP_004040183.1 hypothetical protein IMG5_001090 [Ichthyophthirius multifiliis]